MFIVITPAICRIRNSFIVQNYNESNSFHCLLTVAFKHMFQRTAQLPVFDCIFSILWLIVVATWFSENVGPGMLLRGPAVEAAGVRCGACSLEQQWTARDERYTFYCYILERSSKP